MANFLFAATPMAGHVNPSLPIVRALDECGHRVRFVTGRRFAEPVVAAGATFVPLPASLDYSEQTIEEAFPERTGLSGVRRFQWDMANIFTARRAAYVQDLQRHLDDSSADAVVADNAFGAVSLLRELGGPPVAFYGTGVLTLPSRDVAPFGLNLPPRGDRLGRLRNKTLHAAMDALLLRNTRSVADAERLSLGLPPRNRSTFDSPVAPDLYLQLSSAGFDYPRSDLPPWVHFVGFPRPAQNQWALAPAAKPTWWDEVTSASGPPLVVVTQGTVATDPDLLLRGALRGLAGENVRVIAVSGGTDPSDPGPLPANARVAAYLPFADLFPHASAVVTNGGFGTVQLALAHGAPLVVAGRSEDKAEIAARVAWSGAGLDLRTERPRPDRIRTAVREVLDQPGYAVRARRLGDSSGQDPARRAAQLLTELATRRAHPVSERQ